MAIKLSDSKSFKLEPMRKNRWVFQFSSIPGNIDGNEEALAFVAHTCNAPALTFDKQILSRMNEKFNYAGLPGWNDISCSFYDFIRNSSTTSLSAGDILYNWASIIYNPLTGQMGYKTQYATSATLAQLDPAGNVVRAWNIFGIFPTSVQWGEGLTSEDGGVSEVAATFAYDLAIKVSDAKSSTESA